jgi:hypothetical protein
MPSGEILVFPCQGPPLCGGDHPNPPKKIPAAFARRGEALSSSPAGMVEPTDPTIVSRLMQLGRCKSGHCKQRPAPPGFVIPINYLRATPSKPIEVAPEIAQALVRDRQAFFRTKGQLKQHEIAARQCFLLQRHLPHSTKLRLSVVNQLFLRIKDQVLVKRSRSEDMREVRAERAKRYAMKEVPN